MVLSYEWLVYLQSIQIQSGIYIVLALKPTLVFDSPWRTALCWTLKAGVIGRSWLALLARVNNLPVS